MDDLRAELELAKSNVGDAVQIAQNPVSTPASKVCLVPLDLALNLDVCVEYLIQFATEAESSCNCAGGHSFECTPSCARQHPSCLHLS
jgi:hypothetical protein